MRTVYHEQLAALATQLGEMCGLAGVAMKRATQALLEADIGLAEQVITDHEQIVAMSTRGKEDAVALLALQQPVASELRAISAPFRSPPTWTGWARWPCMWPRSPGGGTRSTRCPRR